MADITSNLVVYYPFDTNFLNYATGTGVSDTTNFGTTINNSTYKIGSGSSKYVADAGNINNGAYLQMSNITNNANFFTSSTNGISFSLWVNYGSNTGGTSTGGAPRVFDFGQAYSYGNNCIIYLNGSTLTAYVSNVGSAVPFEIGSFPNGGWKHIVWTLTYSATGTGSTWTVYVDNNAGTSSTGKYFPLTAGSSFLGRSNNAGDGYYYGFIDDFRVYQRVLTATDVAALYNYTGPADITSNLVVYYPFNSNFLDYSSGSGVSNTTAFNNPSIDNTIYKIGTGSLNLINGTPYSNPQYLRLNSTVINNTGFPGPNGVSFALWFKVSSVANFARFFDFYYGPSSTTTINNILLCFPNVIGSVRGYFAIYNGSTATSFTSIITANYADTAIWHHVVWTISSSGANKLYIDGNLASSATATSLLTNTSSNSNPSYIGASNNAGDNAYLNGNMDDFRVYQRVLSPTDVTALYNYTGPSPGPSPADNIPCFREGTQILCFHNGQEQYLPVEKLRTGTLVKTLLFGYIPIDLIGKKVIDNPSHLERIEKRLFLCSKEKYPELFEDLYITGDHSILVDELTEEQKEKTLKVMKDIFITDNKYRLLARIDERTEPFAEPGKYTIYHFALENDNYNWNYGVYANGLLVESCSKEYLELFSGMEII